MKIITLASGSKGNSSYIEEENTRFLIDIGIRYRRLEESLKSLKIRMDDIDFLLITHTHSDHILGLKTLLKNSRFPVYIQEEMYPELKDILPKDRIEFYRDCMNIKDIKIDLIHTSHDAKGSVGFLFHHQDHSLVYITDTGYINRKYLKTLKNKEIYYIESNHDEKMLMDGPYPYKIKQRIISDVGHLSNNTTSTYLKELVGPSTKYIILAHLSETNNTKDLALKTAKEKLETTEYHPKIFIAEQDEIGEKIEV